MFQINQIRRPALQSATQKPVFSTSEQLNYSVKTDRLMFRDMNGHFIVPGEYTAESELTMEPSDDMVCPICQNLLLDPFDCFTCDTSFCKSCILDYIKRQTDLIKQSNSQPETGKEWTFPLQPKFSSSIVITEQMSCPLGCEVLQLKPAHKRVRETLATLEIRCKFWPKCEEIVSYCQLASHEKSCDFNQIKCPNYARCKSLTKSEDLHTHLQLCRKQMASKCCHC